MALFTPNITIVNVVSTYTQVLNYLEVAKRVYKKLELKYTVDIGFVIVTEDNNKNYLRYKIIIKVDR